MINYDTHSVRSGNFHTLTITTPVAISKEPTDYDALSNKPKINGVELVGDVGLDQLGIQPAGNYPSAALTTEEIDEIIDENP